MRNTRLREQGVTLVESIIALVVIAVLGALGTPALLRWATNIRLTSTTSHLAATVQLARLKAITQNASMRLVFDRLTHTYQLQQRDPVDITKWNNIEQATRLPADVRIDSITGNPIIFQSGRGSTVPGSNSTITLQTPQGKKTAVIVAQTGRVTVQKF